MRIAREWERGRERIFFFDRAATCTVAWPWHCWHRLTVTRRPTQTFVPFSLFLFPVIPKLLPFTFGEKPLNSGQVVTVPCAVVEGDQPLKLRWTLNGHAISPHSGISIVDLGGRGAILSIGSVQATHAGTYTCIAENLAGRHELSADLIVNGA